MTDALLALLPTLGPAFLGLVVALGCLGVPLPSSLGLLFSGALAASGEIALGAVLGWAFAGAIVGDQAGFALGRLAADPLTRVMTGSPRRAAAHARAVDFTRRRGGTAVFLSRWLITPLCPVVNVVSGAGALPWARFALADAAGEFVWVALYVGLGYAFSANTAAIAELLSDAIWLLLAAAAVLVLAWRLRAALRAGEAGRGG